jgi:hypothetical protein
MQLADTYLIFVHIIHNEIGIGSIVDKVRPASAKSVVFPAFTAKL